MNILEINTEKFNEELKKNYLASFNKTFSANKDTDYFNKKFSKTTLGFSFHSLVLEKNKVIASCSIIPYEYKVFNNKKLIGLAVDTFILEKYRKKNPFLLRDLYYSFSERLKKFKVIAVVAVPNKYAFNYWVKILNFKKIKNLNYYVFPKNPLFFLKINFFLFDYLMNIFSQLINFPFILLNNSFKKIKNISLIENKEFNEHRYCMNQSVVDNDYYFYSYSIRREMGINICFLIDFREKKINKRNFKSLKYAINSLRFTKADILVYVGDINIYNMFFLKIPNFLQPQNLPLIIDILNNNYKDALIDGSNWEFDLYNFDVR